MCPGSEPGDSNLAPGTGMQAERVGSADSRSHPGSVTLGQARPPCSSASPGSKGGQAEPKDRLGQGSAPKYQPWGRSISTHQAFHGCVHLWTLSPAGQGKWQRWAGLRGVEASPHLCLGSFLSSPASRDLASGLSVRGKRISSMRMSSKRRS